MNKRILFIVIGAAAIVLGLCCLFDRKLSVLMCGIGLFIFGVGEIVHWRERKKAGAASIWVIIAAAMSIVFGIVILAGSREAGAAGHFLLISISIWLIAEGVFEVLGAVMYRKAMTTEDLGVQAPGSAASMVLGVLMVVFGVLGLVFPAFAEAAAGIWVAFELIISGIRLVWHARTAGYLEEGC